MRSSEHVLHKANISSQRNDNNKESSTMTLFSASAWRRHMAVGMMTLLILPSVSKADTPAIQGKTETAHTASGVEEAQPKFIWGILIKYAASQAFDVFYEWYGKKLFQNMKQSLTIGRAEAVSPPGAATLAPAQKGFVPIVPNVTDSAPTAPLAVEGGKENYQGALLSLLVLQPDGRSLVVRPISAGFKSGEKFRIRIGATFDGELSLDNINPQGERSRLYPAQAEQIVKIKSGMPVILPLDKDSFFQFDDVAGEEKLVVSLRDPRAQGDATAQSSVHRQESEQGTGLLQEVTVGKYAAIAESIALQHRQ
jgi:hypothetical protein